MSGRGRQREKNLEKKTAIEKVMKYITGLEKVLIQIKPSEKTKEVIELAKCYLSDAKYYLYEKGDWFTSLACVAYGEGLLDALKILGLTDIRWPRRRPKVLVGGVFDILHPGHLYLFRKAKEYGTVIAVVARDKTVENVKGRRPVIPEAQRLEMVRALKSVDQAMLGSEDLDIASVINIVQPDIIILGPDQGWLEEKIKALKENIVKNIKKNIKIIKLKNKDTRYPMESSSIIIEKIKNVNQ